MVYEEPRGDIEPLLRLHRLSKVKCIGVKEVVNLLATANDDLEEKSCTQQRKT